MVGIAGLDKSMETQFEDTVIGVGLHGEIMLIGGPHVWQVQTFFPEGIEDYLPYWDGEEENPDRCGFPTEPGVYRCTIEYIFVQGYFEGYMCDSESDVYINCIDPVKIISSSGLPEPGGYDGVVASRYDSSSNQEERPAQEKA